MQKMLLLLGMVFTSLSATGAETAPWGKSVGQEYDYQPHAEIIRLQREEDYAYMQ